jgi:anthranilate phosphoribosyltransferase
MNQAPDSERKFRPHFEKVADGKTLSEDEAASAFDAIMEGGVPEAQMAGFLVAMRARGETVDEIAGAVRAMRGKMVRLAAPEGAMDIVGTGGDARGTYNVSTATAFVVAGAGVPVAKHGNRAVSSSSGAADVLEILGINLAMTPDVAKACLDEAGIAFLFAPTYHPAMRFAVPVRKALKLRTIFNLLGPLCNPADTKLQLIGVFSDVWLEPVAETMRRMGAEHVWVVHGADGLDELSTTGPSQVIELRNGETRYFEVTPDEIGVKEVTLDALLCPSPEESASSIRSLLKGQQGPFRDIVLLNAAAALIVAGKADTLKDGAQIAAASIDEGKASAALEKLIERGNA